MSGRRSVVLAGSIALLAAVYFVGGTLGLELAFVHESATAVWPPTGLSIAALMLFGPRLWPGVLIGAFVANVPKTDVSLVTLGIAIGNTLEAVVATALVSRFAAGRRAFESALGTIKFCGLAGVLATAVSATIGVASLFLGGRAEAGSLGVIWLTWWLGDLAGAVLLAPALVLAVRERIRWSSAQALEAAGILVLIVGISLTVFGGLSPLPDPRYPVQFLATPVLIWVAFRFGPLESALGVLVTAALAIWGTLRGSGAFAWGTTNESLLLLQSFMSVTALSTLILAAAVRERRTAQAALQAIADDLARSNADLERFAHAASHDLKEPLRSIVSFTQLLASRYRGRLDADADEFIRYAVEGGSRLERLIDGLLAYSRAGTPSPPAPVDAAEALEQALAGLHTAIVESGAVVTHDELPVVSASAGQLTQLLQNLVSNAVKFRGAEPPRVHVSARREDERWVFTVRDNGIGIDERFAARVFTMFQRLHNRAEYDGSGIGLALCKRIVERHGGRIWLESVPGRGTTFYFSWPA